MRRNFDHDFGRQPQMMKLFVKLFGPYPLSTGYTVVVTDDDLEIPLEAQGISIFGANHCDGQRSAERLIAHELAHQWFGNSVTARRWRHIWLHEGFACYAEWLWSEHSGGPSADDWARHYYQRLADSPQNLLLADPGPRDMFDDRVYKRGALTLHVLRRRIGDESFFALLRDWTTRYRHSTAVTDDFTGLAANYAQESLRPLWDAWLYSTNVPPLDARRDRRGAPPTGPITRASVTRVGAATVLSALCGYAVLYLAARDLEPAGFSVFGVFWGAFGLVTGAAFGLLQEATREVRSARLRRGRRRAAHASDAGGGDGRRGRGRGDRREFAAVVGACVRRVAVVERGAAQRRAGRFLPARNAAGHAGRGEPVDRSTGR